jgi:hypothetical protein
MSKARSWDELRKLASLEGVRKALLAHITWAARKDAQIFEYYRHTTLPLPTHPYRRVCLYLRLEEAAREIIALHNSL